MIDQNPIRERVTENGETEQLRAAVYARTSSQNQEYGYSLDAQVRRTVDRCESLGWEVGFVYRDGAESGKDTDRPMFKRMLSAAEKRVFDVIAFWKLDRFSRSLMHAVQLESDLREHEVSLYSVTEQIDTTSATGRFNFRNLASAAEFERDMIKQRTQIGLNGLAEEHKWPNDTPPLGHTLTENNRLAIDEAASSPVRETFEMYIQERSRPAAASQLTQRNIQTPAGGEWTAGAVGDILRNEIYRGLYELGDISEHVPEYQIIDDEMFEEVTKIRMRFQQGGSSRPSMPDPRKEEIVEQTREMYDRFL
jgi:site-specific DNA recombinase